LSNLARVTTKLVLPVCGLEIRGSALKLKFMWAISKLRNIIRITWHVTGDIFVVYILCLDSVFIARCSFLLQFC